MHKQTKRDTVEKNRGADNPKRVFIVIRGRGPSGEQWRRLSNQCIDGDAQSDESKSVPKLSTLIGKCPIDV